MVTAGLEPWLHHPCVPVPDAQQPPGGEGPGGMGEEIHAKDVSAGL